MVISYPLTKVKGYIYLNIYCERSLGLVNTRPIKKPQEKFLRFFFEVVQAQVYYTLINLGVVADYASMFTYLMRTSTERL